LTLIKNTDYLQINNCKIFQCTQTWNQLDPSENSKARFCQECEKFVYLCQTVEELYFHANRLNCVTFSEKLDDYWWDELSWGMPKGEGDEREWMWMGHFVSPDYTGTTMTLYLKPTYNLDRTQIDFLSRAFDLGIANYRLREILCDGQRHVLKQDVHPGMAESLSEKLKIHNIEHQLSIDPE
jgi:hypothetical protein